MIRYTPSSQLSLENFKHPFHQQLDPNNRWVQLAELVPWDDLADIYAKHLSPNAGRLSVDIRMVIGALIIKHKHSLSDRDTVQMISENIYMQYFLLGGLALGHIYSSHNTMSPSLRLVHGKAVIT